MTLPMTLFMIYVAFLTTTMFFVAVKPFFELKKGKKLGWVLIYAVYAFNDFFWAWLKRFSPFKEYQTVEVISVYVLSIIILCVYFKGNMIRNFCHLFAIDFIYQCCAMVIDLFVAMIFVGNSMDKMYKLLEGYTWPSIFCFTSASIIGGFLAPPIVRLIKKMNVKVTDLVFAGLALLDINALVINSPDSLRIVFPGFITFLLIYLFFQDGKSKQMQSQFQYYSQIEKYERRKNDELSKLRHDIANHLEVVDELKKQYINELISKVDNVLGKETGVRVLDCLMRIKKEECREAEINFDCELIGLEGMKASEYDMVSLLANLLDNAIESCQAVEGDRKITFEMERKQDYLLVKMENTKSRSETPIKNNFKSIKDVSGTHGIGTRIIKEMVNKYDGVIEYKDMENTMLMNLTICIW